MHDAERALLKHEAAAFQLRRDDRLAEALREFGKALLNLEAWAKAGRAGLQLRRAHLVAGECGVLIDLEQLGQAGDKLSAEMAAIEQAGGMQEAEKQLAAAPLRCLLGLIDLLMRRATTARQQLTIGLEAMRTAEGRTSDSGALELRMEGFLAVALSMLGQFDQAMPVLLRVAESLSHPLRLGFMRERFRHAQ